jgi:hypothetical protein
MQRDENEDVPVNGHQRRSASAARRCGLAVGVLSSRWRRKKTTSSFPSRNGIPGRAGSWAELLGRLDGLRQVRLISLFSVMISFLFSFDFCFEFH